MRISEYPIRPSREAETQPFRGKPRKKIKNKPVCIIKTSAKIQTLYHTSTKQCALYTVCVRKIRIRKKI